jgi:hypothetical protein
VTHILEQLDASRQHLLWHQPAMHAGADTVMEAGWFAAPIVRYPTPVEATGEPIRLTTEPSGDGGGWL